MMTYNHDNRKTGRLGSQGFSLIELMVVVAILGILAAAVGVYINNADANLKSFAFNLGSRFKQAKLEAMKRGHDVYMDFDVDNDGVINNGFTMWVNNDDTGTTSGGWADANANGLCEETEGDCVIAQVVFPNQANPAVNRPGPQLYSPPVAGGPAAGPAGRGIGDGVSANNNRFRFRPSGDCSAAGEVYVYFPRSVAGVGVVAAGPWAIIVNSVGRIRTDEWRSGRWQIDE